jgi:hypothetical protein
MPMAANPARKLVDGQKGKLMTAPVAIALMLMLRDCADTADDWNVVLGFIDGLPDDLKSLPELTEHRALALSNAGWHVEAVAALEALVDTAGRTPERPVCWVAATSGWPEMPGNLKTESGHWQDPSTVSLIIARPQPH